jgi:DNA-directed RNA polymerase subunit RPC12/RpoP
MERSEAVRRAIESENCLRPSAAFALLADETRVRILEALWHAGGGPVRFSTLHEAADTDTSPQLNYHLRRLTGQFVRKTDRGYQLRTAGEQVIRAVVAGSFNAHPEPAPFETDDPCTRCGATLVATYDDEQIGLRCPACGAGHGRHPFPPGGFIDRDWPAVLRAFDRRVRHVHRLAADGVCHRCAGRMDATVGEADDEWLDADRFVTYRCQQCRRRLRSTVGLSIVERPPVVSFHRDHGVALRETPYWTLEWCVGGDHLTGRSTDPRHVRLSIPLDGRRLDLALDDDLAICETTRRPDSPRTQDAPE